MTLINQHSHVLFSLIISLRRNNSLKVSDCHSKSKTVSSAYLSPSITLLEPNLFFLEDDYFSLTPVFLSQVPIAHVCSGLQFTLPNTPLCNGFSFHVSRIKHAISILIAPVTFSDTTPYTRRIVF